MKSWAFERSTDRYDSCGGRVVNHVAQAFTTFHASRLLGPFGRSGIRWLRTRRRGRSDVRRCFHGWRSRAHGGRTHRDCHDGESLVRSLLRTPNDSKSPRRRRLGAFRPNQRRSNSRRPPHQRIDGSHERGHGPQARRIRATRRCLASAQDSDASDCEQQRERPHHPYEAAAASACCCCCNICAIARERSIANCFTSLFGDVASLFSSAVILFMSFKPKSASK
jgi:hypothetical protein